MKAQKWEQEVYDDLMIAISLMIKKTGYVTIGSTGDALGTKFIPALAPNK